MTLFPTCLFPINSKIFMLFPQMCWSVFPQILPSYIFLAFISTDRITNSPYARVAGNIFDKPYTNYISQWVLHFKWQKANFSSAKPKKFLFDHITKTGRGITGDKWTATDQSFSAMLLCCGFHFLLLPKGIFATQGIWRKQFCCYTFTGFPAEGSKISK